MTIDSRVLLRPTRRDSYKKNTRFTHHHKHTCECTREKHLANCVYILYTVGDYLRKGMFASVYVLAVLVCRMCNRVMLCEYILHIYITRYIKYKLFGMHEWCIKNTRGKPIPTEYTNKLILIKFWCGCGNNLFTFSMCTSLQYYLIILALHFS